jgi:D-alanyl-D-alanine dipeptidase
MDCAIQGQTPSLTKYPNRVSTVAAHQKEVQRSALLNMVDPKTLIPELIYDLRYATQQNFTGKRMYPKGIKSSFLRVAAAKSLKIAADSLRQYGLGIKIFDAYRPFRVTVRFWKLIKDERYVANPTKGSGHNRGIAVDLTLYELKSGAELNMGTGFDNFSDTAHHSFENLPAPIANNRFLLKRIMTQAGFNALETEWWHYALPNPSAYSILDIPFKKLKSTPVSH